MKKYTLPDFEFLDFLPKDDICFLSAFFEEGIIPEVSSSPEGPEEPEDDKI